ncbi:MAG: CCA tRNA nucleotidyltransferase [Phycisphaerales bacterium]|nr:CCA tRNA nucleotidyltransferase [Phycisphaerales bacterium]
MTQPSVHFDSKEYSAAIKVIETLRMHGHIAYLAGGCVRDLLLGVEPKDFDIATDARPEQIESYFRKTASVGAAFGVMLVRDFGETIEVATFRSDGVYSDTRRPDSIEFSSPAEDAKRRDFTINALFYDPFSPENDRVIDFVDGLDDMHNRILRAVGVPMDRLAEDHLRALRAVRFAAKYELAIDERTKTAIREHASELSGVSIERIGEEVRKMLMHTSRVQACDLIDELGLDDAIFGDVRSFDSTVMESLADEIEYPVALSALAIGRGFSIGDDYQSIATKYRTSLDLSNTDQVGMRTVLGCLDRLDQQWECLTVAQKKRLASRSWSAQALDIYHVIHKESAQRIHEQIEQLTQEFGGLCPKPLISGADLIELGCKPGPEFKDILDAVYNQQLEGRVQSQPQAIEFVQKQVRSKK